MVLRRAVGCIGVCEHAGSELGQALRNSARHPDSTSPALFKPTVYQFTANALPAVLWHMLQIMKQQTGARFLLFVRNPDFRQALVWRQLTHHAAEVLTLHAGDDALNAQGVSPQGGDGKVGSLGKSEHQAHPLHQSRSVVEIHNIDIAHVLTVTWSASRWTKQMSCASW